jgi:hypothetical protein
MENYWDTPWIRFIVPVVAFICALVAVAAMAMFGIATARVARDKGRNPAGWFLIGFFLLLPGLALALVMLPADYYRERAHGPQVPV